jgi:HlyD family secretion protein
MIRLKVERYLFLVSIGGVLLLFTGCTGNEKSDAYGQFEAVETTISSKASGELLSFDVKEGRNLKKGQQVGLIDTTQLWLKMKELQSRLVATQSKITSINAEIEVQKEQLQTARTNLKRIKAMLKDSAATHQQLDEAEGKVRTLRKQIDASQTQKESVRAEVNAVRARQDQIAEQLKDAGITNPVRGTVLNAYVEAHELISRGQRLYQIASLDTLELRIYISGAQLPSIKLGQNVEVLVDKNAEENQSMTGQISWIASEAEFTPKMIQTKEERVTQVYAVKVKVPNPDGILKIGMPGEVNF